MPRRPSHERLSTHALIRSLVSASSEDPLWPVGWQLHARSAPLPMPCAFPAAHRSDPRRCNLGDSTDDGYPADK